MFTRLHIRTEENLQKCIQWIPLPIVYIHGLQMSAGNSLHKLRRRSFSSFISFSKCTREARMTESLIWAEPWRTAAFYSLSEIQKKHQVMNYWALTSRLTITTNILSHHQSVDFYCEMKTLLYGTSVSTVSRKKPLPTCCHQETSAFVMCLKLGFVS